MSLNELTQIANEQRDQNWENQFFVSLTKSKIKLLSPEPQVGPDNFPYLLATTEGECEEDSQQILHWLSTKGIGLVINPMKEYPDYVFTYGMIWSFKETGFFYKNAETSPSSMIEVKSGESFLFGEPSMSYLPQYTRNILKDFFRDQGLHQVKVLVFSEDKKHFDLLFSLTSLGNPPQKEHDGIAEAISWFLPPHYSIALVHESGLPGFYEL